MGNSTSSLCKFSSAYLSTVTDSVCISIVDANIGNGKSIREAGNRAIRLQLQTPSCPFVFLLLRLTLRRPG